MTFTSDPRLIPLEYMMQQVPRYRPDPSQAVTPDYYIGTYGIYLRKLQNEQCESSATVPDQLSWEACLILMASLFQNPTFEKRIQDEILNESEESKMFYKSHLHRRIFKQAIRERKAEDRVVQAVLYLLTANRTFWNRIKFHVTMEAIRFENFPMKHCTPEEYTLFCCAKDLYSGTRHITVTDLADPTVVSAEQFRLICNAMTIARYGLVAKDDPDEKGANLK